MSRAEAKTPRPEMIRLLQQALRLEYEDVFLYLRESSLFKKKLIRGERLGQIFSRFCDSEISHADRVATALMEAGIRPAWDFQFRKPFDSLRESLLYHLEREKEACRIYRRLVVLSQNNSRQSKTFKGIFEEEVAHMRTVRHLLNRIG